MNFYKHYIGDFQRDTRHLSPTERGVYRDLLDHLYATEKPIPTELNALNRIVGCQTKAERDAVARVVREFFTAMQDGLIQKRAMEEIAKASKQRETNREIGKRGGRPKRTEPITETETESVIDSVIESEPNRNPNQTPDLNTKTVKQQHTESNSPHARCSETVRVVVDNPTPGPVVADDSPGQIAAALRRIGVDVTSQHPVLLVWVTDGFRIENLQEAVEIARVHKPPPQRIPAKYLDTIVRTLREESNKGGTKNEISTRSSKPKLSLAERATAARRDAERALDG